MCVKPGPHGVTVQAHEQGHNQLSSQCTHSVMVVTELDGWDEYFEPLGRTAVQSAVYDVVNAVAREG